MKTDIKELIKDSTDLKKTFKSLEVKNPIVNYNYNLSDPTTKAIIDGEPDRIESYIQKYKTKGLAVPSKNAYGLPWILLASYHYKDSKQLKIIDLFLSAGLDVNEEHVGISLIGNAITKKDSRLLTICLKYNANVLKKDSRGNTLLIPTVVGMSDFIKTLLEKGVDINHQNNQGITALMNACLHGSVTSVKKLLEYSNLDINLKEPRGKQAIHFLLQYPCQPKGPCKVCIVFPMLELLLKKGSNTDELALTLFNFFEIGKKEYVFLASPLSLACSTRHYLAVKRLMQAKVDVNSWYGFPLYIAAYHDSLPIVKALLENGAKLDSYVPELGTALIGSTLTQKYEIVEYLLLKGADIFVPLPDLQQNLFQKVMAMRDDRLIILFANAKLSRDMKLLDVKDETRLLTLCYLKLSVQNLNDQKYVITDKVETRIFKTIISAVTKFKMLHEITLTPDAIVKAHTTFIQNSKIIKLTKKSKEALYSIHSLKDLAHFEGPLEILLNLYWENSTEKMNLESEENKQKLFNSKKEIFHIEYKTQELLRLLRQH